MKRTIDYYPRELDYIPMSTSEFVQNFLDHYITFFCASFLEYFDEDVASEL